MDLYKMKTFKLTTMATAVALLALGATEASADGVNGGTLGATATASVDNAVVVAQTTPIQFGSLVIITDGVASALDVVMSSAGAMTWPGTAGIGVNYRGPNGNGIGGNTGGGTNPRVFPTGAVDQTAGVFTITGGAENASMGIIYNNTSVDDADANAPHGVYPAVGADVTVMTCGACAGGNPVMWLGDFVDNSGGDGIVNLDGTGAFTLNVGGTLRIDNAAGDNTNPDGSGLPVANGAYQDGTYTGTVQISAVY